MERLTKRKLETLRFAGRLSCARPPHIESRFGVDRSTAYRHLRSLTEMGMLVEIKGLSVHGSVFAATREGLKASGLGLTPSAPTPYRLPHEEAVTEVICDLESRAVDCLTERELSAHKWLAKDGRFDFEMWDPVRRKTRRHLPDIACEVPGTEFFVAIEVERRAKNVDVWREILRGFAGRIDVDGFIGVLYVASPAARPRRIAELASEVGLGERFQLRMISDSDLLDGLLEIVDTHGRSFRKAAAR